METFLQKVCYSGKKPPTYSSEGIVPQASLRDTTTLWTYNVSGTTTSERSIEVCILKCDN